MVKKTKKVEVTLPVEQPKTAWQKIKDWFYNSGTIMSAWIKGAVGAVTATVMGVLASTDYSSIFQMLKSGAMFTKSQLMVMGLGALLLGVVDYFTRVRGTKAVDGHLLPKASA